MFKLLLKLAIITSLLINSAGQPALWAGRHRGGYAFRTKQGYTLRPLASASNPEEIVGNLYAELLPGAEQALKLLDGSDQARKLIHLQEKRSMALYAPMGLEIETVIHHDFSKGILSYTPEADYVDGRGKRTESGDGSLMPYYEYRVRPSWSVLTQLAAVDALRHNGLEDKTIISMQLNIGVPFKAFSAKNIIDLCYDAKRVMLMIVLAYVSDRRIYSKKTHKVVELRAETRKSKTENINSEAYIRMEYAFADIENIEQILKAIHCLHSIIYAYHSEEAIGQTEETKNALANLYIMNFYKLARLMDYLYLNKIGVDLNSAYTFRAIPPWREDHKHEISIIRSLIEEVVAEVDNILDSMPDLKYSSRRPLGLQIGAITPQNYNSIDAAA